MKIGWLWRARTLLQLFVRTSKYPGNTRNRATFFRPLIDKLGCKERMELRLKLGDIVGDIRENISPFFFDDWDL
jgi:hypothetical protein